MGSEGTPKNAKLRGEFRRIMTATHPDPAAFKAALVKAGKEGKKYDNSRQHDSHEFLLDLSTMLGNKERVGSLIDDNILLQIFQWETTERSTWTDFEGH